LEWISNPLNSRAVSILKEGTNDSGRGVGVGVGFGVGVGV